jgi:hypothetical protein
MMDQPLVCASSLYPLTSQFREFQLIGWLYRARGWSDSIFVPLAQGRTADGEYREVFEEVK